MSERRGRPEQEQDRGTKAEHGIGRPDAEMEDRGTKAEHGIGKEDEGIEDRGTKAESGIEKDTEPSNEFIRVDTQSPEARRTPSTDFSSTMKSYSESTGFLDNSGDILLDADLTAEGRQRLAKVDGIWVEADEDADWDDAPQTKADVKDTDDDEDDEDDEDNEEHVP